MQRGVHWRILLYTRSSIAIQLEFFAKIKVRLEENSIPYTAFATPDGLFEYLVTPMGISSRPSSFNRLVCAIFSDYNAFCQTYFDDFSIQVEAFQALKAKLTTPPVLAHTDFTKPFHVNVDASDFAVGGYLFQLDEEGHEKVIAYG
ncbi:hypothetical protein PHMEG_00038695, partial [Phytophthora megakarya]